jgi:hypothetical protein
MTGRHDDSRTSNPVVRPEMSIGKSESSLGVYSGYEFSRTGL